VKKTHMKSRTTRNKSSTPCMSIVSNVNVQVNDLKNV